MPHSQAPHCSPSSWDVECHHSASLHHCSRWSLVAPPIAHASIGWRVPLASNPKWSSPHLDMAILPPMMDGEDKEEVVAVDDGWAPPEPPSNP